MLDVAPSQSKKLLSYPSSPLAHVVLDREYIEMGVGSVYGWLNQDLIE